MNFTDGKPRIATESDLNGSWRGAKGNFRCYLCGYKFKLGDYWRWVYTNNIPNAYGNPLVCRKCDTADVVKKWKELKEEFNQDKFWALREF